ncbi:MAG: peptidoglycan-binding protein [bacterium]|nr:peptidoglycan-binding protein [bacterium]
MSYDRRIHQTLRRGARGDSVVRLQRRLVKHHSDLDEARFVDGDFGPGTERQVKRFQQNARLAVDGVVGRNTWSALLRDPNSRITSPVGQTAATSDRRQALDQASPRNGGGDLATRVKRALERKGYVFLDDRGTYNLNIVGIRSASNAINSFDDEMVIVYRDSSGSMQAVRYPATTDPGEYYTRTKLLNKAGAAILVPGQYRDTYQIAKHRGKYDALCQKGGKVRVWRDGNMDDKLDRSGKTYEGWYGINIHRAGQSGTTSKVGRYSAGCQVLADANDFGVMMSLAQKSQQQRRGMFTYTLLEAADLR